MPLAKDILHPTLEAERQSCKLKRLVQSPNSYFMDVKYPGCYKITTVFSHAQTVVLCVGCSFVLCQPTGGKARLTEGRSFRRKQHWGGGRLAGRPGGRPGGQAHLSAPRRWRAQRVANKDRTFLVTSARKKKKKRHQKGHIVCTHSELFNCLFI